MSHHVFRTSNNRNVKEAVGRFKILTIFVLEEGFDAPGVLKNN